MSNQGCDLCKVIEQIYSAKMAADAAADKLQLPHMGLLEFCVEQKPATHSIPAKSKARNVLPTSTKHRTISMKIYHRHMDERAEGPYGKCAKPVQLREYPTIARRIERNDLIG